MSRKYDKIILKGILNPMLPLGLFQFLEQEQTWRLFNIYNYTKINSIQTKILLKKFKFCFSDLLLEINFVNRLFKIKFAFFPNCKLIFVITKPLVALNYSFSFCLTTHTPHTAHTHTTHTRRHRLTTRIFVIVIDCQKGKK